MIPEWKPSWGYRSKSHTQTQKKERKITVAAAGRNSKFSKWFEIGVVYSGTKEPIEVNDRGGSLLWLLIHRRDRTGGMFARSNFMKLYHQLQKLMRVFLWGGNRARTRSPLARHSQLPLQARSTARSAVHLPGQTRMGPVLLQSGKCRCGHFLFIGPVMNWPMCCVCFSCCLLAGPGGERSDWIFTNTFYLPIYIYEYYVQAFREPAGLLHKNQQVFIVMNPIDLNLEPPILAVSNARYHWATTTSDKIRPGTNESGHAPFSNNRPWKRDRRRCGAVLSEWKGNEDRCIDVAFCLTLSLNHLSDYFPPTRTTAWCLPSPDPTTESTYRLRHRSSYLTRSIAPLRKQTASVVPFGDAAADSSYHGYFNSSSFFFYITFYPLLKFL